MIGDIPELANFTTGSEKWYKFAQIISLLWKLFKSCRVKDILSANYSLISLSDLDKCSTSMCER